MLLATLSLLACGKRFDPNNTSIRELSRPQTEADRNRSIEALTIEVQGHEREFLTLYDETESSFLASSMAEIFARNKSETVSEYINAGLQSVDLKKVSRALAILRWRAPNLISPGTFDFVFPLGSHQNSEIRILALSVAARQASSQSRDLVKRALHSANGDERRQLLLNLSASQDQALLKIVGFYLKDSDSKTRMAAAQAMLWLDREKAIAILEQHHDQSEDVARYIKFAISNNR